jgi:hypothetical protein
MQIDGKSALVGAAMVVLLVVCGGQQAPPNAKTYSPWIGGEQPAAVTQSADGRTIYFWSESLIPKLADPTKKLTIQGHAGEVGQDTVSADQLREGKPAR